MKAESDPCGNWHLFHLAFIILSKTGRRTSDLTGENSDLDSQGRLIYGIRFEDIDRKKITVKFRTKGGLQDELPLSKTDCMLLPL